MNFMKIRFLKISILVTVVMILTGCQSSAGFKRSSVKLEYEGNPTTGYNWFVDLSDESVVEVSVKQKYLGKKDVVGAPSKFYYTVSSLSPGKCVLRFDYKRDWEKQPPLESHIFDITVLENGEIKIQERPAGPF